MISVVKYQIATYSGEIEVHGVDENEDADSVCARAREQLRRRSGGSLPFGYQHFEEVARGDE